MNVQFLSSRTDTRLINFEPQLGSRRRGGIGEGAASDRAGARRAGQHSTIMAVAKVRCASAGRAKERESDFAGGDRNRLAYHLQRGPVAVALGPRLANSDLLLSGDVMEIPSNSLQLGDLTFQAFVPCCERENSRRKTSGAVAASTRLEPCAAHLRLIPFLAVNAASP